VEALAKKERERVAHGVASNVTSVPNTVGTVSSTRNSRADSPASSDGSTTVSANSSPGVDQQLQDRIGDPPATGGASGRDNSTHFNPINEVGTKIVALEESLLNV